MISSFIVMPCIGMSSAAQAELVKMLYWSWGPAQIIGIPKAITTKMAAVKTRKEHKELVEKLSQEAVPNAELEQKAKCLERKVI